MSDGASVPAIIVGPDTGPLGVLRGARLLAGPVGGVGTSRWVG